MVARRSVPVLLGVATLVAGLASGLVTSSPSTATEPAAIQAATSGPSHTGTLPAPPRDRTPPAPVTRLALTGNNAHTISLGWTNPTDPDFAGVLIRRAAGDTPPVTAADGTLVATLSSRQTSFTDKHLGAASSYSYAVFGRDTSRNVGIATTLTTATRSASTSTGLRGELADQQGRGLSRARVEIRDAASGQAMAVTATASTGQFSVTNLAPGSYLVCFQPGNSQPATGSTGYLSGCHRPQPDGYGATGTPVTVQAGQLTSGLLDEPPAGGALAGRITDSAGTGLPNVLVQAFDPSTPEYGPFVALTDQDGGYTVGGLAAGSYEVCFYSPDDGASPTGYLDECYDNQPPHTPSATQVAVELGQTSAGIDAALAAAGAVTGLVTDPGGAPVSDIEVRMYGASQGAGTGRSDDSGAYTVKGLPTGSYTLCFDGSYTVQPTAPYGYTSSCVGEHGVTVNVVADQITTSYGTVERAGAVSGVVTGAGPVAGVWVSVYDSSGSHLNSTNTDDNGSYQISGLAPGQVTVCFDPTYTAGGYQRTCYGARPDGSGTPVTVTAGGLSTADVHLQLGASITGTVTDASGTPVSDVLVSAYGLSSGAGYYSQTDQSGSYTFSGVTAEDYQVCFDPSYAPGPATGGYAMQCYHDQPSAETANPVTVAASGAVTVDAVLGSGAAVTGQVTDSDGNGIPNASVQTYSTGGWYLSPAGVTDDTGHYELTGVPATAVVVCFQATDGGANGTGYLSECYDDQPDVSSATPVSTTAGEVSSGVNAELADAPPA